MPKVFTMRAYDPAGEVYVYWDADEYDLLGGQYSGPPDFGTLQDVSCILEITTIQEGLFLEPFNTTQRRTTRRSVSTRYLEFSLQKATRSMRQFASRHKIEMRRRKIMRQSASTRYFERSRLKMIQSTRFPRGERKTGMK